MTGNKSTETKSFSKVRDIPAGIHSKTRIGDLRRIAKDIKENHELAMELWSTEEFFQTVNDINHGQKNFRSCAEYA